MENKYKFWLWFTAIIGLIIVSTIGSIAISMALAPTDFSFKFYTDDNSVKIIESYERMNNISIVNTEKLEIRKQHSPVNCWDPNKEEPIDCDVRIYKWDDGTFTFEIQNIQEEKGE